MSKIIKNLISGITALSLCTAMIGFSPVNAEDSGTLTVNRKMYVDFMGRGSTPATESPGKARLSKDDVGNEFWVGVAVDKVHDLTLFTDGVYSLEVAFEYNPDFLEPYTATSDPDADWLTALTDGNLSTDGNNSLWWNSSQYEIISVRDTDLDTTTDRENKDLLSSRSNWRMCTVCVTFKDGITFENTRFQGLTEESKQYLLKLPFKLKKVPADGDADQNPTVLSLVRGPETLDIGSGQQGKEPYSAWEATVTDPDDATNMKTLFTFGGDISLFDAGASITGIVPVKTKTGDETEDTTYTLSTSKLLQSEGFDSEKTEYYLSVPNETEKLKLNITSSDAPTVKANGTSVNANSGSNQIYVTDEFVLAELNKDTANGGEEDGFNNTVTVESGGKTYKIHIRRLLKPKIELNYGNSPYGLIQQDDTTFPTQQDKDDAKQAFEDSHTTNKTYGSGMVPVGGQTKLKYNTQAWSSYQEFETDENGNPVAYNGDKDETAMFIFQRRNFRDVGFTAYDAMGDAVDADQVTRHVEVKSMKNGVPNYDDTLDASVSVSIDSNDIDDKVLYTDIKNINVRPDVYRMTYSFTDSYTQTTITVERKLIVVSRHGDALINNDNTVNNSDASTIITNVGKINSSNSLYRYRIADALVNNDNTVNNSDASTIVSNITQLGEFYNYLPSE